MAPSIRLWLETQKYRVRIPAGSDICHRGCAYTVHTNVQMPEVYSVVYGTVPYKESFSHSIRVGRSPDFGFPSVAISP